MTPEEYKTLTGKDLPKSNYGLIKESTPPSPPERKIDLSSKSVSEMRELLELKKLEKEIEKLDAPTGNLDYFSQMMKLQNEYFTNLIHKESEISNLKVEIERLKLANLGEGGDFTDDLIGELIPMLPQILAAKNNTPLQSSTGASGGDTSAQPSLIKNFEQYKGGQKMRIPTAAEIEEYSKKIKNGEVTKEQFYEDALKSYPELARLASREQVYNEYEKIKNS